jgi:hypothetical protein
MTSPIISPFSGLRGMSVGLAGGGPVAELVSIRHMRLRGLLLGKGA